MSWYWWLIIYLLIGSFITAVIVNFDSKKETASDTIDEFLESGDGCGIIVFSLFGWPIWIFLGIGYLLIKYTKNIAKKLREL